MELSTVDLEGKTSSRKFKNKDGMKGLLAHYHEKTTEILHFHDIVYYKEVSKGEEHDRYTGIEVAIAYEPLTNDDYFMSFCNTLYTSEKGTHEDATRAAIIQVMNDIVTKSLSENQAKNLTITSKDILKGLRVYVNVYTKSDPDFTGQIKEKVGSQFLYKVIRPMVVRNLRKLLSDNEKLTKKFCDLIKLNAKARQAAEAGSAAVVKKSRTDFLDDHDLTRFIPSDVDDSNHYSEIIIVEGDSAGESMRSPKVRMPYQAIMYLRGMSLNSYKSSLAKVMENPELRTIINQIKAGIGDNCDPKKSMFNKIIINTDADSDGKYIRSSLAVFFLTWLRPLVESGMVYINLSPLYRLADKEHRYVRDKSEYFDIYVKKVNKDIKIGTKKDGILSKEKVRELLENNRDYTDELERLVSYFNVHRDILEFIIFHYGDKDFEKSMFKRFPELTMEKNLILGVHDGQYQVIKLNKQFFKRCNIINELAFQKDNPDLYFQVFDRDGKLMENRGLLSLGQLLLLCSKYRPKVEQRFKGLGEFSKEELRDQTLNPVNRKLVQLTVRDMERALEEAETFFGNDPAKRKKALSEFNIRRDELDN